MDLGFPASAWQRAVLGLGVACLAGGLLLLVEHGRALPVAGGRPPAATAVRTATLRIDSSFPVATWSVSVAGREIPALHHDATGWEGTVVAAAGAEVLVEARPAAEASGVRCALRLVMAGDPAGERSAWGDGGVVATVTVP